MGLFRDVREKPVGLGTYVIGSRSEHYLIIRDSDKLAVLDLNTNTIIQESKTAVEDPKWITRNEFDALFLFNNYTQSDYSYFNDWNVSYAKL